MLQVTVPFPNSLSHYTLCNVFLYLGAILFMVQNMFRY